MKKLSKAWEYTKNNFFFVLIFYLAFLKQAVLTANYIKTIYFYQYGCYGNYILQNGIIHENPFVMTKGLYYPVQQWLFSVLFAGTYKILGVFGIFIFNMLFFLIRIYLFYKIAELRKLDMRLSVTIVCILESVIGLNVAPHNPIMVTVVLLLIQIYLTENYIEEGIISYLIPIPLLAVLEANLHGSQCLLHAIFMLPYIVPGINLGGVGLLKWKKMSCSRIKLAVTAFLCVLATAINPYGLEITLYLVKSLSIDLSIWVEELRRPYIYEFGNVVLIVFIILMCICVFKKMELYSPYIYLFCGTFIMYAMAKKCITYLMIGFVLVLFEMAGSLNDRKKLDNIGNPFGKYACLVLALSSVIIIINGITVKDMILVPDDCLDDLAPKGSSVFSDVENADIFEWKGYKVCMDTQYEEFYKAINKKEDVMDTFVQIYYYGNKKKYEEKKNDYDFFFVREDAGVRPLLESDEQMKKIGDVTCKVQKRTGDVVKSDMVFYIYKNAASQ